MTGARHPYSMSDTGCERITDAGVVAVLRGLDHRTITDVAEAIVAGGVDAVEVTMDSEDGLAMLDALLADLSDDVAVGVGTVLDAGTATAAIDAGAEFVVAPTFDPETVAVCDRRGVPVAPGVATPTEAHEAMAAGADLVKLFPAAPLGPDYLASIRGPLGHLPVMPTGGIGPDNAGDFFDAGACAVGVGSALVDDAAIERGDYDAITETAEELVEIAATHRD
jgi:2-dehydro-3-deoxyphosphogluconate aldolase/(4S)-4-hydroxy-2-oxoglutarate aldolase